MSCVAATELHNQLTRIETELVGAKQYTRASNVRDAAQNLGAACKALEALAKKELNLAQKKDYLGARAASEEVQQAEAALAASIAAVKEEFALELNPPKPPEIHLERFAPAFERDLVAHCPDASEMPVVLAEIVTAAHTARATKKYAKCVALQEQGAKLVATAKLVLQHAKAEQEAVAKKNYGGAEEAASEVKKAMSAAVGLVQSIRAEHGDDLAQAKVASVSPTGPGGGRGPPAQAQVFSEPKAVSAAPVLPSGGEIAMGLPVAAQPNIAPVAAAATGVVELGGREMLSGEWHKGIFACEFGKMCCAALWCQPITTAQLAIRTHTTKCVGLFLAALLWVLLLAYESLYISGMAQPAFYYDGEEYYNEYYNEWQCCSRVAVPNGARTTLMNVAYGVSFVYSVIVTVYLCRARSAIRKKDSINEQEDCCCDANCNDCMCAFCCAPCTTCQLLNQVGLSGTNKYNLCSSTGDVEDGLLIRGTP